MKEISIFVIIVIIVGFGFFAATNIYKGINQEKQDTTLIQDSIIHQIDTILIPGDCKKIQKKVNYYYIQTKNLQKDIKIIQTQKDSLIKEYEQLQYQYEDLKKDFIKNIEIEINDTTTN